MVPLQIPICFEAMTERWTDATEKNVGCCLLRDDIIRAKIDFIPARTRRLQIECGAFRTFYFLITSRWLIG
jgi:hypothetical protein